MTYQPFLPEAAAGNISPRHAVVPLRRELKRCRIVSGEVTRIEHARKTVTIQPIDGPSTEMAYDHIIVAPGSVSRTLPIPGLREHGIGFKTIGEAIYLRNHILDRLDVAAVTPGPGGPPGVADLRLRRRRLRRHRGAGRDGGHGPRRAALLPRAGPGRGPVRAGRGDQPDPARGRPGHGRVRGPRSSTRAASTCGWTPGWSPASTARSCSPTATRFRAETLVWTAGVKPSPMLDHTDLPRGAARPRHLPAHPAGRRRRPGARRRLERPATAPQVPDLTNPGRVLLAERPARRPAGQRCWPTTSGR